VGQLFAIGVAHDDRERESIARDKRGSEPLVSEQGVTCVVVHIHVFDGNLPIVLSVRGGGPLLPVAWIYASLVVELDTRPVLRSVKGVAQGKIGALEAGAPEVQLL
jgi:hypothetical protein